MAEIDKSEGGSSFDWIFPVSGLVSGIVGVDFGMVIGGISRDVFVEWIVGMVVSLIPGVVGAGLESLGFCTLSVSSVGDSLAELENVLSFPIILGVLAPRGGCLGVSGVFFFSVGSVGSVRFGARDESGGCGGGWVCFSFSVSSFVISTMAVSWVISLMMLES